MERGNKKRINVKEMSREEKKIVREKREGVKGNILSKEVTTCIHRDTHYGVCYIEHGMPALDRTESICLS